MAAVALARNLPHKALREATEWSTQGQRAGSTTLNTDTVFGTEIPILSEYMETITTLQI